MDPRSGGEAPLHVPEDFEAAYLDEARRTVRRSHAWWRSPRIWVEAGGGTGEQSPHRFWRSLAVALHGLAVLLALTFAAMTGTWEAGAAVIVGVAVSLAVVLRLLRLAADRLPPGPRPPDTPAGWEA